MSDDIQTRPEGSAFESAESWVDRVRRRPVPPHILQEIYEEKQAIWDAHYNQTWTAAQTANDAALGIVAGVEGFGKSVGKLVTDIGHAVGLNNEVDQDFWKPTNRTQTIVGGFTDAITQYSAGYLTGAGLLRWAGVAKKVKDAGLKGKFAYEVAKDAFADFLAFDENEGRLMDALNQVDHPAVKAIVIEYLTTDKDDSWLEGRFKNVLEGGLVGIPLTSAGFFIASLKARKAAKAGDTDGFVRAVEEMQHFSEVMRVRNEILKAAPHLDPKEVDLQLSIAAKIASNFEELDKRIAEAKLTVVPGEDYLEQLKKAASQGPQPGESMEKAIDRIRENYYSKVARIDKAQAERARIEKTAAETAPIDKARVREAANREALEEADRRLAASEAEKEAARKEVEQLGEQFLGHSPRIKVYDPKELATAPKPEGVSDEAWDYFKKAPVSSDPNDTIPIDYLKANNFVTMTASNPSGKILSDEENLARNIAMRKELTEQGFSVAPAAGMYGYPEDSFVVFGSSGGQPDVRKLLEIARKYDQESIAHSNIGLLYTDGRVNPKTGPLIIGDDALKTGFFSVVTDHYGNKYAFHIPIDINTVHTYTFNKNGRIIVKRPLPEPKTHVLYHYSAGDRSTTGLQRGFAGTGAAGEESKYFRRLPDGTVDPESAMVHFYLPDQPAEQLVLSKGRTLHRVELTGRILDMDNPDEYIPVEKDFYAAYGLNLDRGLFRRFVKELGYDGIKQGGRVQWFHDVDPSAIKHVWKEGAPDRTPPADAVLFQSRPTIDDVPEKYRADFPPEMVAQLKTKASLQRAIDTFESDLLPTVDEVVAGAKVGEAARGGYQATADTIAFLFPDDVKEFALLNAVFSPDASVAQHTAAAVEALAEWTRAERPRDLPKIRSVLKKVREHHKGIRYNSRWEAAARVLSNPEFSQINTGQDFVKAPNFGRALAGDLSKAVLDRWMGRMLGVPDEQIPQILSSFPNYLAFHARLSEAGRRLGWTVGEIQETTWASAGIMASLKGMGYSDEEAINLITDDLVRRVWSLADVFNTRQVQDALRRTGTASRYDSLGLSLRTGPGEAVASPAQRIDPGLKGSLESLAQRIIPAPNATRSQGIPLIVRQYLRERGLLRQGERGFIHFVSDGSAVIGLMKNADASTVIHELFHFLEKSYPDDPAFQALRAMMGADQEGRERMASLFEAYLHTGTAPSPELQPAFDTLRDMMARIYKGVLNSPLELEITDDVRRAFDDLFLRPRENTGSRGLPSDAFLPQPQTLDDLKLKPIGQKITDDMARQLREQALRRIVEGGTAEEAVKEVISHFNYGRRLMTHDAEQVIEDVLAVVDDVLQKSVGGRRPLAVTEEAARKLASGLDVESAVKLAKREAERLKNLDVRAVAIDMVHVAAAEEYSRLMKLISNGNNSQGVMEKLERASRNLVALQVYRGQMQTFIGRALKSYDIVREAVEKTAGQALGIVQDLANGRLTRAEREKLIVALASAGNNPSRIVNVLQNLNAAVESRGRAAMSMVLEYWINSLLSGPVTHITNLTTGLANAFVRPFTRMVGGALTFNGAEARAGLDVLVHTARQFLDMVHIFGIQSRMSDGAQALRRALQTWRNEQQVLDTISKVAQTHAWSREGAAATLGVDPSGMIAGAFDWVGRNIVRIPTRALLAADELLKQVSYRAYIHAEALKIAREAGINDPKRIAQVVDNYMSRAFDIGGSAAVEAGDMFSRGVAFAEDVTFTRPLKGMLKKLEELSNSHPIAKIALTFVRTPYNIFEQAWHYTPGLNLLNREFRQMLLSADPAERAEAVGRLTVGAAISGGAYMMAQAGLITGGGPSDPNLRRHLLATGWRPYSFVHTDDEGNKTYYSFDRLDPLAMVFGLAADLAEATGNAEDQEVQKIAVALVTSVAKMLKDKTYLRGVSDITQAVTDPDRNAQRWLQNLAGTLVPNFAAQLNPDDTLREVMHLSDALRRRTPGLSESLPPRRDLFGEPVLLDPYFGGLLPVRVSESKGDTVRDEIANLKYGFRLPNKKLNGLDLQLYRNAEGQDAYDRYLELHSEFKIEGKTLYEAMKALIQSRSYQRLPPPESETDFDSPRVQALQQVLAKYRRAIRQQLLKEYPELRADLELMSGRPGAARITSVYSVLGRLQ